VDIKVVVETKCDLQRTIDEGIRVLGFRGKLTGYLQPKDKPGQIILIAQVSDTWKLDSAAKLEALKNWIPAKFNVLFKVIEVTELNLSEKIAKNANLLCLLNAAKPIGIIDGVIFKSTGSSGIEAFDTPSKLRRFCGLAVVDEHAEKVKKGEVGLGRPKQIRRARKNGEVRTGYNPGVIC
jgi:hypothetical protein